MLQLLHQLLLVPVVLPVDDALSILDLGLSDVVADSNASLAFELVDLFQILVKAVEAIEVASLLGLGLRGLKPLNVFDRLLYALNSLLIGLFQKLGRLANLIQIMLAQELLDIFVLKNVFDLDVDVFQNLVRVFHLLLDFPHAVGILVAGAFQVAAKAGQCLFELIVLLA